MGAARQYAPADGSSTRGGSTSVRGRVRSPHISGGRPAAGSQRADSLGSCATQQACYSLGWDRQTDERIAVSLNVPYGGGIINETKWYEVSDGCIYWNWCSTRCGCRCSWAWRRRLPGSTRQRDGDSAEARRRMPLSHHARHLLRRHHASLIQPPSVLRDPRPWRCAVWRVPTWPILFELTDVRIVRRHHPRLIIRRPVFSSRHFSTTPAPAAWAWTLSKNYTRRSDIFPAHLSPSTPAIQIPSQTPLPPRT